MSSSYRQIGGPNGHLARLEGFRGHSLSARMGSDGVYRVVSYDTEIARVDTRTAPFEKRIRDRYYSPTTTRGQNLCRAWLPGEEAGGEYPVKDRPRIFA